MPAIVHKRQIIGQATNTDVLVRDTVGWTCKNALINNAETTTIDGVTFTVNDDKSISTSGTATSDITFVINERLELDTSTRYVLTGCPYGGSTSTFSIRLRDVTEQAFADGDIGSGYEFDGSTFMFAIIIISGTAVNGLTFRPMVRKYSVKDTTYEPYHITVEEELEIIGSKASGEIITTNMLAENWNNGVYSFENEYPNTSYDVEIEPDGDRITDDQYKAWCKAGIVGSASINTCKAMITPPNVNIPIILKVMRTD